MDTNLEHLLEHEERRQATTLNLIASENYSSREVKLALTSIAGDKYAEGYPGVRYYGGCQTIDEIEELAIKRACDLYAVEFANVQPHSGSSANLITYQALLKPGDRVLAQGMDSGGHLTHGSKASSTASMYEFAHYGVGKDGRHDMAAIEQQASKFKPQLIIAGTSAYPRDIDWAGFRRIADSVGALLMADIAHTAGLIAGGALPSPIDIADVVTTTTQKTLRGPRGGMIMTNSPEIATAIDKATFPGFQGGPHMHTIAAKAQCLYEASQPEFATYATQVIRNARVLTDELTKLEVQLWSGGTDTHLLNLDVHHSFELTGVKAEELLAAQGVITNRELLPGDELPAWITSGVRLGTAALTTRGLGETEMRQVARMIVDVLRDKKSVKPLVADMTKRFPL